MERVNFQLVDMASWKSPNGKSLSFSGLGKRKLIKGACRVISSVMPVKPSWFKPGKARNDMRLLAVLANGKPMSVLYYRVKGEASGKRYLWFHHANAAKSSTNLHYVRQKGESPARSLFRWMRRKDGKNSVLIARFTVPGARFMDKLERAGVLRQTATGDVREYVFTRKRMPRIKVKTRKMPKISRPRRGK
ncbi:MAG: hypothetical protein JW744_00005 [Candidatus Diapherotrites archaeon]|uniref:Uncharacterized protein n=1 Tax=Candidatus Iainarchaeum sp. TaxID=3101447 RepID=A0A938YMB1_9ARCH|nr:hypothetical protein [Candidatus Diapherotrites archaeon]